MRWMEWVGFAVMAGGVATWPLLGEMAPVLLLVFVGVLIAGWGTTRRDARR
jgi:hypothetical protein